MRSLISPIGAALVVLLLMHAPALAQTGKISGVVTDAATGEPLPGVNVVIDGTTQGTATDIDGFYNILNVEAGTHAVRASFIGYTPVVVENVRVNIDLTTTLNIELREEAVGLDEVIVEAEEPIVRPDISANVANLSSEDIENIPVTSVEDVVSLQPGVEAGLSIRGSGRDEVALQLDGASMRDGRTNQPYTAISYTSIQEVQVQTGGFNAEYGNVRSGMINVVTKDGPRNRYSFDVLSRYSPAQRKYFGPAPNDPQSYYMRPFVDPEIMNVGTMAGCDANGQGCVWDKYVRRQYYAFEEGYNLLSENRLNNDNPNDDMTPNELRQVFDHFHRRNVDVESPDFEFDGGFGGPVPGISRALGDLRFWASYRQTQSSYIVPLFPRDSYRDRTARIKVTSDVASGVKLSLQAMRGIQEGINSDNGAGPGLYTGEMPPYPWSRRGLVTDIGERKTIFSGVTRQMTMDDVTRTMFGGRLTHTLSANTFYELNLQRMHSAYDAYHQPYRDTTTIGYIGTFRLDASPIGLFPNFAREPASLMETSHSAEDLDSSRVAVWSGSLDFTSQVNRYLQVKTGLDANYSRYKMLHGTWEGGGWEATDTDWPDLWDAEQVYRWARNPLQGAAYAQGKLEFQGMIANLGLRLDYFDANTDWYAVSAFDSLLSSIWGNQFDELAPTKRAERHVALSPRLGVSFPITTFNKLYLNYGHFRQMLNPGSIFEVLQEIDSGSSMVRLGNPNHPMPLTVSYELGYEHNLFNRFLLRLTGYYKALEDQPRYVRFFREGSDRVDYRMPLPFNYEDVRGFEVMLQKTQGRYFRGFVNYTYMVYKGGNFGWGQIFANPTEQQNYLQSSTEHYPSTPAPEPYARANLEFFVPSDFGPELAGASLLGDWRIVTLLDFRGGTSFTWSGPRGGAIPGLQHNVRTKNYFMADLRLSKNFETTLGSMQFFVDIDNVINRKNLYLPLGGFPPFSSGYDWDEYMTSLHLPEETFEDITSEPYNFVYGDDRPGDFREDDIEFHPIEVYRSLDEINLNTAIERPLYYVRDDQGQGNYYWYRNGEIQPADEEFVEWVLDNKAYIDMPNIQSFRFLNPRRVSLGLRLTF